MKKISRIEALVGAFGTMYGAFHDPVSKAYRLRNPLMLKAFSPTHEADADGYRVFNSLEAGLNAGRMDLEIKCSGRSHAKLNPETDTLYNLVACFGIPRTSASYIKKYLRRALDDENILENTPLKFFLADREEIPQTGNTTETA